MLADLLRGSRRTTTNDERTALESGIAEAKASIGEAHGADHAALRATLAAFIAQCERRIAEIARLKNR